MKPGMPRRTRLVLSRREFLKMSEGSIAEKVGEEIYTLTALRLTRGAPAVSDEADRAGACATC
jgi:hypothetical protein